MASFLLGLGFLTITFFRWYTGDLIPYPFVFWISGLAMVWSGILFLRFTPSTKDIQNKRRIDENIKDLKENGEKIIVDLTKCELKENSFTEERERYGDDNELLTPSIARDIEAWNAIGGDSMRNIKQVEVIQTVIIYSWLNNKTGKTEIFNSRVINKDKITLSFYLDREKKTALYVDKLNREKYYFDLDFLNA
ncbi:MAG TPA: hypothetical protein VNX68_09115 [Nitrosopumilaceae archaeon]|nr:hypothetical protein [Nitrosopumilaceae archaeon]